MADLLEVGDVVEYLNQQWTVTETHDQDEYSFTTLESIIGGAYCSTSLNPQAVERLVKVIKKYFHQ